MTAPNFALVSEIQSVIRRDFTLADTTLLQPLGSNPLIDGEWVEINSDYKVARGTGEATSALQFPVFTERGRSDTQALGKCNVLFLGQYEAETSVYDSTSLVLGSELTVQDVTISSLTRRGLKLGGATSGRVVVGYVSKLLTGKIRFIHFNNYKR